MQIIVKCLLQWDVKTQTSRGKGIVGKVRAFAPADEEQGRNTLHRHWQIWVEELNQNLRDMLFDKDPSVKREARHKFCAHVDEVMSASYGTDLKVTHKCMNEGIEKHTTDFADEIYQDREPRIFRNARHKKLCHEIKGEVMECKDCGHHTKTIDVINLALQRWKQEALKDDVAKRLDTVLPLSNKRLDIAAYTYSYHNWCASEGKKALARRGGPMGA